MMIIALGMVNIPSAQAGPDSSDSTIYPRETKQAPVFKGIRIYPNPVYEELTIKMPQKVVQGYISIFNIKGEKLIESEFSDTHEMIINIRQLQQGLYIVKLFDGLGNHIAKFIKK